MKGFPIWLRIIIIIFVIAVGLPILLSIVLIALNPAKQFSKANDAKRKSDAIFIYNALGEYAAEHGNQYPQTITTTPKRISSDGADLCSTLVGTYLPGLPQDPSLNTVPQITNCNEPYNTGYDVFLDNQGKLVVQAPLAELTKPLTISR